MFLRVDFTSFGVVCGGLGVNIGCFSVQNGFGSLQPAGAMELWHREGSRKYR